MKPLSAGEKDQYITLRQRASGVDSLGQESTTWNTVAQVWAQALPLRGREYFAAGQAQSEATVKFRIDFRTDVQPTWQVLWRSQAHDIVHVADVEGRRTVLELMCATGARDGR
jgi:SPP1 family predicted phage head-tail adaptor